MQNNKEIKVLSKMTKSRFNLRKVASGVACLAVCMMLVGCGGRSSPNDIITMTTNKSGNVKIYLSGNPEVVIDWGDGTTQSETLPLLSDNSNFGGEFEHSYSNTTPRTITITGSTLFCLQCDDNQLMSIDVSRCPVLMSLVCRKNQLTNLDVSKNPVLRKIDCSINQLTGLDVSKNPVLEKVNCSINQFTEDALRSFIESWNIRNESAQISFIGNPGSTDEIINEIKSRGFQIFIE